MSQTERGGRRKREGHWRMRVEGGKKREEKSGKTLKILVGAIVPGEYSRQAKALCIGKWHSAC